jgi:hypothetical protein
VETVEHLDLLRDMGCDFAQGFLFSRPLELEQVQVWFAERPHPQRVAPPGERPQLPDVVAALAQEGASLHTIAAALNARGSRTSKGTRWSARSVAHLVAAAGSGLDAAT